MTQKTFRYTATDINKNLQCSICHGPFVDPVTVEPCQHTFCRDCIESCAASEDSGTNLQCPLDRCIISMSTLKPANLIIRNMVDELEVYCDNCARSSSSDDIINITVDSSSSGCQWTGQRCQLASHLESECKFTDANSFGANSQTKIIQELKEAVAGLQLENERIKSRLLSNVSNQPMPTMNNNDSVETIWMLKAQLEQLWINFTHQQHFMCGELAQIRLQIDRLSLAVSDIQRNSLATVSKRLPSRTTTATTNNSNSSSSTSIGNSSPSSNENSSALTTNTSTTGKTTLSASL